MSTQNDRPTRGSLRGTIYGDLVGSPYMIENTYNRYFELGESRKAYSHGKVRTFFPQVTEVSHAAAAVSRWLSVYRDKPSVENLQAVLRDAYAHHPRGGWTETTRLFLTGDTSEPSQTPDWAAIVRTLPVGAYSGDDFFRAMDLAEAAVKATCWNDDAVRMGQAITQCVIMSLDGKGIPEMRTMLEHQYGLHLVWNEEDLRAELRGEVREPLIMLGKEVPGAYRYVLPESPLSPSARIVTEAALQAVLLSDSWEDAVRRAVSYGGPSNAVAAIAGGVAESLYGEVTPSIVGRLFNYLPTDISSQLDALEKAPEVRVKSGNLYESVERDGVDIISLGPGETVYVIPEERKDLRKVVQAKVPNPRIITPEEEPLLLKRYEQNREGTYAFGTVPEKRMLYVQDGKTLVSPSAYIAPGMPPLQERKRHLEEFLKLRSWCIEQQKELNRLAGNDGAGQIHYGDAYHLWIGARKIDFFIGEQRCGSICLDYRGLLRVDIGEARIMSADSRFENHHEQAWAARGIFTIADTIRPLDRLQNIREEIAYSLLDLGKGGENHEIDTRYMSDDDRESMYGVSNIDHLQKLDSGEEQGVSAEAIDNAPSGVESSPEGKVQSTNRIYSIGYGARTQQGFINTLKMSGIDTVVDVRSIPRSKYVPHFNEEVFYDALSEEGIDYLSAGQKLGGRITDIALYENGQVSWDKVSQDADYKAAVASLEQLCEDGHVVAIVCSEGDPLSCHRFGLLSRTLDSDGMDVRHILTNGEVVGHEEMEARLVDKYSKANKISCILTGSYRQQLDEAYKVMNEERGYKPKGPLFTMGSYRKVKF